MIAFVIKRRAYAGRYADKLLVIDAPARTLQHHLGTDRDTVVGETPLIAYARAVVDLVEEVADLPDGFFFTALYLTRRLPEPPKHQNRFLSKYRLLSPDRHT